MKELPAEEEDCNMGPSTGGMGATGRWMSSLIDWSYRYPLVFAVYVLVFGHAIYRIVCILANPIGTPNQANDNNSF